MKQKISRISSLAAMSRGIAVMAVAAIAAGCQTEEIPEVSRGRKVRTEVIREEASPYLVVEMVGAEQEEGFVFEIESWQQVRVHERDIHQKMHVFSDPDDINRERYRYVPVPDEEMPGETRVRTEKRGVGPLADERVRFRDAWHTSNSDGIVKIDPEQVLRLLDTSGRKQFRLDFFHPDFGTAETIVSREELLSALGVDTTGNSRKGSDAGGLKLEMSYPETAADGDDVTLHLHACNQGGGALYGLQARTFSHAPWLDELVFHIGHLKPGESRQFQRTATVPPDHPEERVFVQVGVRHAEGALEKSAMKIILTVEK